MKVLVTGGAGYIGSVIVQILLAEGNQVRILDDLSTGHREAIPDNVDFIESSLLDSAALELALTNIDGVIHCAGKSLVSESVSNPEKYHLNNVEGSAQLIAAMKEQGVRRIVFSSSAATYRSQDDPLTEESDELPSNPYGMSKLLVDQMLLESGFEGASLRYFNVAGAHFNGKHWFGERHSPESHLIPNVLSATPEQPLQVFGDDWPTTDGTCVRDYIHVADLARAHLLALNHQGFDICNLGSGSGSSVSQVIETASRVLERQIPKKIRPRREGDPAVLVASYEKAHRLWGWKPEKTLMEMIADVESFTRQPW